eukprot:gnl/Spiro4/15165_TR8163_c0_g1_i1.p1 gnl/Spiro4/15165_TR8163_c0_g1~~gnl/Spiro4/15165_TR8163_c0_g1_i1.p1  ORF type:complete len:240 (+),score=38.23 gnl/Spiro4/15165_TR8163_c0_g1_i1:185-904(+)
MAGIPRPPPRPRRSGGGRDDGDDDTYDDESLGTFEFEMNSAVLADLKRAWINERLAPEILHYEYQFSTVTAHISQKQAELEAQPRTDGQTTEGLFRDFRLMEIERFFFIIRAYHRARLRKLEVNGAHILGDPALVARLSTPELEFATQYLHLTQQHYLRSFVQSLPENFRSLDREGPGQDGFDMVVRPNLSAHVLCRINENIGVFEVNHDRVDLRAGEVVMVPYHAVRTLIYEKRAELL